MRRPALQIGPKEGLDRPCECLVQVPELGVLFYYLYSLQKEVKPYVQKYGLSLKRAGKFK